MPSTKTAKSLVCDVYLHGDTTTYDNSQLTVEFIKFLCLQKGQIPVPFSQLKRLSSLASKELEDNDKNPQIYKSSRERHTAAKKKRRYLQFAKKAEDFEKNLDHLGQSIVNSFELQNEKVAVVLGTSVFNPKETFILDWSLCPTNKFCNINPKTGSSFKSNQANFFRYLVTAEELFPYFQTMRPTKLHVVCQNNLTAPANSIPRINYKLNPFRGRQVTLRILPKVDVPRDIISRKGNSDGQLNQDTNSVRNVSRRLLFSSPRHRSVHNYCQKNISLDLSGFDTLQEDDDLDSTPIEPVSLDIVEKCWFEIQTSLIGFVDALN